MSSSDGSVKSRILAIVQPSAPMQSDGSKQTSLLEAPTGLWYLQLRSAIHDAWSRRSSGWAHRYGAPDTSSSGLVFHLGLQPGFSIFVRKITVLSRSRSFVQMNFAPLKSAS